MTETTITDVKKGRSGYGSAPLTVSVYNFDPSLGCDDATFQPCSPRALSSLKVVGDHFKDFFPISKNFTKDQPPYYGFFTEDEFIGGHVSMGLGKFLLLILGPRHKLTCVCRTASILRFLQLCRAIVRRTSHMGLGWLHRSHPSLAQVLETI